MSVDAGRPARPAARGTVGAVALACLAMALAPARAAAQGVPTAQGDPSAAADDSTARPAAERLGPATVQVVPGEFITQLPVDRVDDVLQLLPGASTDADGGLMVRGASARETATYVDGIPVTPGYRALGDLQGRSAGAFLEPGVNALDEADLITGLAPASFGHARAGIVSLTTRRGGARWEGGLAYETDGLIGGTSYGVHRLRGSLGGPLGRTLSFFAAGVLDGRLSAPSGFGAKDAPIFVTAGVDTTVSYTDANGFTQAMDLQRFAIARGNCDALEQSRDAGIASNYGLDCQGAHTPGTSGSDYEGLARLDFTPSTGTRVGAFALASQDQSHVLDYGSLFDPANQFGRRTTSLVTGLTWDQRVGQGVLRSYLSYQDDRATDAPFESTPGTGSLGFYLKPYHFRYDEFEIDDRTAAAFRGLDRTSATYSAVGWDPGLTNLPQDLVLNNPYGERANDYSFVQYYDAGGPSGRLNLLRESRALGGTTLTVPVRAGTLVVGGETTRHDLRNLSQRTVSSEPSDLYVGKPVQSALFVEQTTRHGSLTLVTGVRYDRFDSRAERPVFVCTAEQDAGDGLTDGVCGSGFTGSQVALGDTIAATRIASNPEYDPANPDAFMRRDRSHSVVSPRVRIGLAAGPRTEVLAAWGRQAQAPDLGLVYAGINTDFATTAGGTYIYGSDLDLARAQIAELGIRQAMGRRGRVSLNAYTRRDERLATPSFVTLYDPLRHQPNTVRFFTSDSTIVDHAKGLDARFDQQFGRNALLTVAYGYIDAKRVTPAADFGAIHVEEAHTPLGNVRPHNLAATLALLVPNGGARSHSADGLFGTFRWASGTAYTQCDPSAEPGDETLLSGAGCTRLFNQLNTGRLPASKRLDLRLSKTLALGGGDLTLYLDARNALNWRNVRQVYVLTGTTESPRERQVYLSRDSLDLAFQASSAGVLGADGSVDLRFGGAGANGCNAFTDIIGQPGVAGAADCVYLSRAEQRWGDGDGVFTVAEQKAAFTAGYLAVRGAQTLTESPRTFRVGMQLRF